MQETDILFTLIGKNIKKIRKTELKISQEKMAEEIDISRSFLSQIEAENVNTGVSIDLLLKISLRYNIDIRNFFEGYEIVINNKN